MRVKKSGPSSVIGVVEGVTCVTWLWYFEALRRALYKPLQSSDRDLILKMVFLLLLASAKRMGVAGMVILQMGGSLFLFSLVLEFSFRPKVQEFFNSLPLKLHWWRARWNIVCGLCPKKYYLRRLKNLRPEYRQIFVVQDVARRRYPKTPSPSGYRR